MSWREELGGEPIALARLALEPAEVSALATAAAEGAWVGCYSCGLRVAVLPDGELPLLLADAVELEHVMRHLTADRTFPPTPPLPLLPLTPTEQAQAHTSLMLAPPPRRPEETHQLWRQGDDGNPFPISTRTSERDATCHARLLEAKGHKQTDWVAPA